MLPKVDISEWVTVRDGEETDNNFIYNSWLKSYFDSPFAKKITKTIFFAMHHYYIEQALNRCRVKIAHPRDNVNQILGYCVFEPECLHYINVKSPMRKMGIGGKLIESVPSIKEVSHFTEDLEYLKLDVNYNPYRFFIYGN